MTKEEVLAYVRETYGAEPEYPWKALPDYAVLRHKENRKWFALAACVPYEKLGLPGEGVADTLNVKADPVLAGSLRNGRSVLPGYHMNHENWLTVLLDGSASREEVLSLLDMSYELTLPKKKRRADRGPREWLIPADPKIYDIEGAIAEDPRIHWKQTTDIRPGDTVYMYVAAPVSAVLYRFRAEETDLPRPGEPEGSRARRMWIRLEKRFSPATFPLALLKEYGVGAVRGPRSVPNALLARLEKEG